LGVIALAPEQPLPKSVEFAGGVMRVALQDGRKLEVPLAWFPRLREATPEQREDLRLIGHGDSRRDRGSDRDQDGQGAARFGALRDRLLL
jgi:hypothetical protein